MTIQYKDDTKTPIAYDKRRQDIPDWEITPRVARLLKLFGGEK